jgi:chromosomal replication initiation ATPase DnaA
VIDDKTLVETFAREFQVTKSIDRAVMAVARSIRAVEVDQQPRLRTVPGDLAELVEDIIQAVADAAGINKRTLIGYGRANGGWRRNAHTRWICWSLMRRRLEMKLAVIGRRFRCHHTSVLAGCEMVAGDPALAAQADAIWDQLCARWKHAETVEEAA